MGDIKALADMITENIRSHTIVHNHVHHNNTVINNVTQVNVIINGIGNESIDHLTKDRLTEYVKNNQIVDLIRDVNFNPNVPENHNVKRIVNSNDFYKNMFLKYFDAEGWKFGTKDDVIRRQLCNGLRIMLQHYGSIRDSNAFTDEEHFRVTKSINESLIDRSLVKKLFALTLEPQFLDSQSAPEVEL